MESILERIFTSRLQVQATPTAESRRREFERERMSAAEDELRRALRGEEAKAFATFCALREAVWYADRYDAFTRGFRLGMRLTVEGLWRPEEED